MTRQDIIDQYETDEHGKIANPGKFEGEPLYVPYFWEAYLNGCADEDDGDVLVFHIEEEDRKEFPELASYNKVSLWEDDCGFVSCDLS